MRGSGEADRHVLEPAFSMKIEVQQTLSRVVEEGSMLDTRRNREDIGSSLTQHVLVNREYISDVSDTHGRQRAQTVVDGLAFGRSGGGIDYPSCDTFERLIAEQFCGRHVVRVQGVLLRSELEY